MSRTLTVAGLLIDSWRDQLPHPEPSEMNLPGSAIPISRFNGTSDDVPSTLHLTSLIEFGAMQREPR
jgi:hypothetical protein